MLTAKADEDEKIEGISIGADDYLTKPFSVRELVVRVRALLRRSYRDRIQMADILIVNNGDLEVDIKKMIVKKKGEVVSLTTNEFKILTILLTNPEQVFSREKLVEKAFGIDYEGFDRTVDTYIKNIRIKVRDNGIGILEKDITYIFERFYRSDLSRNKNTSGSGIGLTITKAFVEAHGGKIYLESKINEGTTVTVEFPNVLSF